MAFAFVTSLKYTIERLLKSSHISLVPPSPEIIEFAYKEVKSLQEILKRLDSSSMSSSRKRVNALDVQIRQAVCKLEDVIESHVSNQIVSQSESTGGESQPLLFSIELQDLQQDIYSFTETVKKLEQEYINELCNPLPEEEEEEEEEDEALSSRIDFGGKSSKMVGLSDQFRKVKDQLTAYTISEVISLVGMAGIGKTTVAKEIFEDPLILSHFDCRVWVTVGRRRRSNEITRGILAQVNPETDKVLTEGDEKIAHYLRESLKGRRYLIVLDDLWDTQVWDDLRSMFPDEDNGSRVLLTTQLQEVAQHAGHPMLGISKMRLLNKEESWDLFREKVFAEGLCPPQLKKAGKKIAESCEGLPLTIVTVAEILSKTEKTPEYWNKVAEKQNSVFMDAYDKISKVLFPSYDYLHQHLKACFLYMGVFPQNYEIPLSKLINMGIAGGFLEQNPSQTVEDFAVECLEELASRSLIMVYQNNRILTDGIKTCGLHSSFWHLCNREAEKNRFFRVLNSCADGLEEGAIKSQRGLCIHNNILFGIKNVYNSMEDDCASTARCLLCFGPYHQYQVPICFSLRLLRILDALTIRFYEFPMEVLNLVQLRYLALTFNGNLPPSISKLWNLQFLIVLRHLSIKTSRASSYLPIEIWDMQELKHLQIMGSNLPNPNCGASLQNLLTLLDVSARSCTKGVLKRIPNLKKLGIQIELAPDDDSKPLGCLNRISRLRRLESLKCVIVNPEFMSEFVLPPVPRSMFPSGLKKLHLSGLGYPWEYMGIIGSLPNLQVLKLRRYAFRGPKWEMQDKGFQELRYLLIEDTDLVQWKVGIEDFPWLKCVSIKHCYKLEEIHWESGFIFEKIEVVDCNPLAVACAKQIKARRGCPLLQVYVHSSWDDGNLKS